MPIRPEMRALYPPDWAAISLRIRVERAGDCCECDGRCDGHGDGCTARNREPHPITGSRVILTVAHLNHDPADSRDENLMAMCQRCHLRYDAAHHASTRRGRTRAGPDHPEERR
jgi:5-methylcytosine-specific restriction endonuclease McrA